MPTLSVKRPNLKNHIAIYYGDFIASEDLKKDSCITEIIGLCGSFDFAMNFTYAIYADSHGIQDNMIMPIFHTYYLNSDPKIVILRNTNSTDILSIYPHHKYYLYNDNTNTDDIYKKIKEQFPSYDLTIINSIKDII